MKLLSLHGSLLLCFVGYFVVWPSGCSHGDAPQTRNTVIEGANDDNANSQETISKIEADIDAATVAGRWTDAYWALGELVEARTRLLGENHWQTQIDRQRLLHFRRVTKLGADRQSQFSTALKLKNQADELEQNVQYEEAEPLRRESLELLSALLSDDDVETLDAYRSLAANLNAQRSITQAIEFRRKATFITRVLFGEQHPEFVLDLCGVAIWSLELNQPDEAEQGLRRAIDIMLQLGLSDHAYTTGAYGGMGMVFDFRGRHAEAELWHEKALDIVRRAMGDDNDTTAQYFLYRGLNLLRQGKLPESDMFLTKARDVFEATLPANDDSTASAYDNLGLCRYFQGRHREAQELHERALEIRRTNKRAGLAAVAISLNNLGNNLIELKRYDEARKHLDEALRIRQQLFPNGDEETINGHINMANAWLRSGHPMEAEQSFLTAIQLCKKLLPDDHTTLSVCIGQMGLIQWVLGRLPDAERLLTESCERFERSRIRYGSIGQSRSAVFMRANPHGSLAYVQAELGKAAEAWTASENWHARGLLDDLAEREPVWSASETQKVKLLREQLLDAYSAIGQSRSQAEQEQHRRERYAISIQLGEQLDSLAKKYGVPVGKIASLAEIQKSLRSDSALIAWLDGLDFLPVTERKRFALLLRSQGPPVCVELTGSGPNGSWTDAEAELPFQLRSAILAKRSNWQTSANEIRRCFFEPLRPHLAASNGLPEVRRLIATPSYILDQVPLEVILGPDDPLVVSYIPSGTILTWLKSRPSRVPSSGLVAVGNPQPVEDPLPSTALEVHNLAQICAPLGGSLVLTGSEATETNMNELAVKNLLAQYRMIHFATHAEVSPNAPSNSAVLLAQPNPNRDLVATIQTRRADDGRLSVDEIRNTWEISADLVTLSCCRTALGPQEPGGGYVGFAQALLLTGAQSVCLSCWDVNDPSTALFMSSFYQNMMSATEPGTKAAALQQAKRWLGHLSYDEQVRLLGSRQFVAADFVMADGDLVRGKGRPQNYVPKANRLPPSTTDHPFDHPYFWAPFIFIGE